MNLTLVYALLAYSGIKKKDFSNVYVSNALTSVRSSVYSSLASTHFQMLFGRTDIDRVWSGRRTVIAYAIAW